MKDLFRNASQTIVQTTRNYGLLIQTSRGGLHVLISPLKEPPLLGALMGEQGVSNQGGPSLFPKKKKKKQNKKNHGKHPEKSIQSAPRDLLTVTTSLHCRNKNYLCKRNSAANTDTCLRTKPYFKVHLPYRLEGGLPGKS